MSKPASNPTRLNREATLAKYRQRQHAKDAMGIGVIKIDQPNRAQRRAATGMPQSYANSRA